MLETISSHVTLKDRERCRTGDKDEKSVNGTQISIGKFTPEKRDYLFRNILVSSTGLIMWIGHRKEIRWPIYIINPVDKTKLSSYTSHRRSTTASLETYPSIPFQEFRLLRKISSGTNQKVVFYLHPSRNFRNFLVNGKCLIYLLPSTDEFLHRRIAANSFLFKIKLSESNLCFFCQTAQETLLHLFWEYLFTEAV